MKYTYLVLVLITLEITSFSSRAKEKEARHGFTYGSSQVGKSPISLQELKQLEQSLLFSEEDIKYLQVSREVLAPQPGQILEVRYGFVGSTPQLVYLFGNKTTGKPDGRYLARVRERFKMWIMMTAEAKHEQAWLDYQYEIGLRHYSAKKNKTDHVKSVPIINYRYIPALTIPVTTTLQPFLAKGGASAEDVDKMYNAWLKSVLLQSIFWGQPYLKKGAF